jgi:hypothetical protein
MTWATIETICSASGPCGAKKVLLYPLKCGDSRLDAHVLATESRRG